MGGLLGESSLFVIVCDGVGGGGGSGSGRSSRVDGIKG